MKKKFAKKNMIFFLISFIAFFVFPVSLKAYIPHLKMILQKSVENHGSGVYVLNQYVKFPYEQKLYIFKEKWTIENENSMKVDISGMGELTNKIAFSFLYKNGIKEFISENGKRKKVKIGLDFLTKYFHFRSVDNFIVSLMANNIIDANSLEEVNFHLKNYDPILNINSLIRLSRLEGVVNYALGLPTPVDSEPLPGMWIEQDKFVIRKIRFLSKAEVIGKKIFVYKKKLYLPKMREVKWNDFKVNIFIASLRSISSGNANINFKALKQNKTNYLNSLPVKDMIHEFYTRFR